jgi:pSer/pThr/pTyr-binding forkhead associated (FHA) protein
MEKDSDEIPFLVAQTGPLNGQRWAIRGCVIVGREDSCDIVIADRQVSRQHARITTAGDGVFLEDLQSKNGTHHNGQPVVKKVYLQDGDIIQVALAQRFVFLSSDSTIPLENLPTDLVESQTNRQLGGRLRLEKKSRQVWVKIAGSRGGLKEEEILPPLSVSQFRLLEILYDNQGRVVPRPDLAAAIWDEEEAFDISEQALDALIRRLRDRIAHIDPKHEYIVTVRGHGLRLENPPPDKD